MPTHDANFPKMKEETPLSTTNKKKKKPGPRPMVGLLEISMQFTRPLNVAASKLGISKSTLKKYCRKNDIYHWPYRYLTGQLSQSEQDSYASTSAQERQYFEHVRKLVAVTGLVELSRTSCCESPSNNEPNGTRCNREMCRCRAHNASSQTTTPPEKRSIVDTDGYKSPQCVLTL